MSKNSKNKQNVNQLVDEQPLEDKAQNTATKSCKSKTPLAKELNGPKGLEPTRYGDWESKGRCYDF
jgi:hypothetical protein